MMRQTARFASSRSRAKAGAKLGVFLLAAHSWACLPGQSTASRSGTSPTAQIHQAVALAEDGKGDEAMRIADQLLDANPKFVPALKLKGMLLEESGRSAEADAAYETGLKYAPSDPDLLLKAGIYKLATGEKAAAVALLSHSARIQPQDGDTEFYLAQAYHLTGRDDLALKAIRASVKAEPGNAAIEQKYGEILSSDGDYAAAKRALSEALRLDATLPRLDYDLGAADYKLMNLDSAAAELARAVKANPHDINSIELLASAELRLSRWSDARETYARLLQLKPNDVEALLNLGHCELELKNYDAAIGNLKHSLQLDPTRLLAHFYLSRAYAALGDAAKAKHEGELHHLMMERVTYVQARAQEQSESAIEAQALALLKEHRYGEAKRLYAEHFKNSSASAQADVFLGRLYLFHGETDRGVDFLKRALAEDPRVRGARTNLGILALQQGRFDEAEADFRAELANDPNYQQAIAEMGEVRYRQQRWLEAIDYLAKSKTMTPELLYMLADAEFRVGKAADGSNYAELAAAYGSADQNLVAQVAALLRRNQQTELADGLTTAPANP